MFFKKKKKKTTSNNVLNNRQQGEFFFNKYNILIMIDKMENNDTSMYIANLANYLVKNNIGVVILTTDCKVKSILNHNVVLITSYFLLKNNVFSNIKNTNLLKHIFKKYHINIIDVFSYVFTDMVYNITQSSNENIHFVSTIINLNNITPYQVKGIFLNLSKKSEKIICFSQYIAELLIEKCNVDITKIEQLNQCVDIGQYDMNNIKKWMIIDTIKSLNTDLKKKILFYPCDFEYNYNDIVFLLNVLSQIEQDDFNLVLCGNFKPDNKPQRIDIVNKIYEKKLNQKVILSDKFTYEQPLYLLSYAIIKLSDKDLFFDNNIIEAYASKKPVIATANNCIDNYVINTKTGFVVRKNGFYETKKAIEDMLNLDEKTYNKMCYNAYTYAVKYFNINKNLKDIEELFTKICQS